jgi:replicative DNA helicase
MFVKKNTDIEVKRKIPIRMDISMMNMIIGVIFHKNSLQITKKSLTNIKKLFDMIDSNVFQNNEQLEARFNFIKKALEAKIEKGFENEDAILDYCVSDVVNKETNEIIRNLERYTRLKADEIKYIFKTIEDRLQFSYLFKYKDPIYDGIEKLDSGEYESFREINDNLKNILTKLLTEMRKTKNIDKINTFSLDDENYEAQIEDIVVRLKDPSRMVFTGLQSFNQILAPGFLSKRTYVILGLPGSFKSGILMSIAYWAKKFNVNFKTKRGKRPTVLYVTLENDVDETIERIFNMTVCANDIRNYTPKEVVKMLKEKGEFYLKDENDMNICIMYFGNREISTWDLYTIVEDMEDDNKEVICIILDYLKRIRSHERAKDEKEELKHITNELKTLATDLDIPVITAHQINRAGASVIDNAAIQNKEDLTNLLGRANTGTAWEIMENADWSCIINIEKKKSTGQYYLTFKRVKIRYRDPSDMFYFNHPFEMGNKMRLITDVGLAESLSEQSLSTDMEPVKFGKGKRSATTRDVEEDNDADIFNFSNEIR